MESKDDN